MDKKTAIKVYSVAVIFAVTTGFSFLAAKYSLMSANPLDALFFRFAVAFGFSLAVFAVFFILKRNRLKKEKRKSEAGDCEKGISAGDNEDENLGLVFAVLKNKRSIMIPAFFYSCGFFGFQFFGLMYSSSVEAGIITACQPAITMVLAEFAIKEKPTWFQRVCVVSAIVSAIFISLWGAGGIGSIDLRGVVLIFLSTLSMSVNIVFIRWKRGEYKPIEISIASCGCGFVVYTAVGVVRGIVNGSLSATLSLITVPSFVVSVIYLGTACTMLTTLMNTYIMKYIEAVKASVLGCAGTVITLIAGHFILDEPLGLIQIVFSAIILFSIVGTNLERFPGLRGKRK